MSEVYEIVVGQTEQGDFLWSVYEPSSEQIVESFLFEDAARKFKRFASNGGAFAGFTPSFMTKKFHKPLDINVEFALSFEIE